MPIPWRSRATLKSELESHPSRQAIERLFHLSYIADGAIYGREYAAPEEFDNLLKLTDVGEEALSLCKEVPNASRGDKKLALLCHFSHHELLIDAEATNIDALAQILGKQLRDGKFRLANRFGRVLYDRFNDDPERWSVKNNAMDPVAARAFLENTPQGVYQLGEFLTGPLGILTSAARRKIPPDRRLPLWHCADTGCRHPHFVSLPSEDCPALQVYVKLATNLQKHFGAASEWHVALSVLNSPREYHDLFTLFADQLVEDDLQTTFLASMQGANRMQIREHLNSARGKGGGQGSEIDIAKRLSHEEKLQLLLTQSDKDLVHLIDNLVASKRIRIPSSEVRLARYALMTPHSLDTTTELSSLGLRSSPPANALAHATEVIWRAYQSTGSSNDLDWRLKTTDRSTRDSLTEFMRKTEPVKAIDTLVTAARPITDALSESLWIHESLLKSDNISSIICWKLGLTLPRFEDTYSRFRQRLEAFHETLLGITANLREDDREKIRAAGVNLFVSLERVLEELVGYTVWTLSSDHFLETRFVYSSSKARSAVAKVLGATRSNGDHEVAWLETGGNTLGPMLTYLNAAVEWVESLAERSREEVAREQKDFPHFARDARERPFPFEHKQLWADSAPDQLIAFTQTLRQVAASFGSARLAEVRNGIEHMRIDTEFPTLDLMHRCVDRIRDAFHRADTQRLLPKTFWLTSRTRTIAGAIEYTFEDYAGRPTVLHGPAGISGARAPEFEYPFLIAPTNFLGQSNSLLYFSIREDSEASRYWDGYPRHRQSQLGNTTGPSPSEPNHPSTPDRDQAI